MNLARFHLLAILVSGRDEAAEAVDPPFAYPGPLRLLKSRMTARYYSTTRPTNWQEAMEMGIAILDTMRHLPSSVEARRLIGGSFMNSYVNTNNAEHLRKAVILLRGVYLSQSDRESRRVAFDDVSAALGLRYADFKQQDDLEELIHYNHELYESAPEGPDKEDLGKQLYPLLLSHYSESQQLRSLELALDIMPQEDPKFEPILDGYVKLCYANYDRDGSLLDLRKAFEGRRRWLALEGLNDPVTRGRQLNTLVLHLFQMGNGSPNLAHLTLGVDWCREALDLEGSGDAVRLQANIYLSRLLYLRFKAHGHHEDIKGAVIAAERVLDVTDPASPQYLTRMDPLVPMLMDQTDGVTVLEARAIVQKALSWSKRIVDICPPYHPQYLCYVCNLGNVYHWCYLYGVPDVEQHLQSSFAILEAAERDSLASEYRPDILSTLSTTLSSLYETTGSWEYLDKGLESQRESMRLRKDDPISCLHLGGALRLKYRENQDLKVLEEAIEMLSKAMNLSKGSPATKKKALRELCGIYYTIFTRKHEPRDIQMAIKYGRDGLKLSSSSRDSAQLLDSLSNAYNARFEFEGEISDLNESIRLLLLAVNDHADPLVPKYLIMLADRLRLRCFNLQTQKDLEDAVTHCQTALGLLPTTHAEYKHAISEMSYIQHELFKMNGKEDVINDGIKSAKAALLLHQSDDEHKGILLDHLGSMFYSKYEKSRAKADLVESIQFGEQALATIPKNSVRYPTILNHTSFTLHEHMQKFEAVEHRDKIHSQLSMAVALPTTRPFSKVRAYRILASLSIHEQDWTAAYQYLSAAIELYPKISPRAFTADEQERTIRDLYGVAQIAASCALNADQDRGKALEVLEAGRGIMAGWLINARNDISRLEGHDQELAARYTLLRDLISNWGRKTETGAYVSDDDTSSLTRQDQWRDYLYELEEIEETVRSRFPNLKSFQRPLSVDDMRNLAAKAPIVEINSTVLRSDAFIVTASNVTTIDLPYETNRKMEDITKTIFGPGRLVRSLPQARGSTNDALRADLKWLYENVVSRIMAELQIKPNSESTSQRLIWVSNGLASFCPLHAADTFSGNQDECTVAHVVSSYIPSLKALQFARERHFTLELHGHNEVLVVAMPKTKGLKDISAIEEAENIASSFSGFPANSVNVLKYPSRNDVLEGLKDSSLAHFACHGHASSTDPSQSCLLLVDSSEPGKPDRLSVRDLSASKHNLARLCYLSACSTAENTAERLTDENMHVASAFQLSGYSHVIGTLWEAGDRAAVDVAKVFYGELADAVRKNSGGIIADDVVAYALHRAVKALQKKKQPGSRLNPKMDVLAWAPFIHLGP